MPAQDEAKNQGHLVIQNTEQGEMQQDQHERQATIQLTHETGNGQDIQRDWSMKDGYMD